MKGIVLTYTATIKEDGSWVVQNGRLRKETAAAFAGQDVEITIARLRRRRTNDQNDYYWGVVLPRIAEGIEELTGEFWTKEDAHEAMKDRYLSETVSHPDGEFIAKRVRSTSSLNTTEFTDYIERCCQFAAEMLGIAIAMPNENQ